MSRTLLAAVLLIAGSAVAQETYEFPASTSPSAGTCNVIPFGTTNTSTTWVNQRYQCMATQAEISQPSGPRQAGMICELAFAPCGGGSGNQHFDFLEIVMGQTNAGSLSNTFASNLAANVQTVLSAKDYDWQVTGDRWNRIGLDKPFNYIAALGTNVVIQITAMGNHKSGNHGTGFHRDGTHQRVYAFTWAGTPPATGSSDRAALKWQVVFDSADVNTFGVGCQGSNNQTPAIGFTGTGKIGTPLTISCSNCLANAVCLQTIGVARIEPRVDLAFLGAPGCFLYNTVDILIGGIADAGGVYSFPTAIPNNQALVCAKVYTQVFPSDPNANNWGRTASNYGRVLAGN